MTDKLREAAQLALSAPGCERLKDWYEIGPAQRAAVETFLEAVLSQQDAQAVNRGYDQGFITRLATLVDKETKQILEDSLSLIEQIKYMVGIAERGTGRKCPDDECPEAFLLAYVKSLEAALAQQDAQAVPLTEKQRVYLAQSWAMLEDYAADQRQAGNDSIADGADASAHEIKLMLNTAPTPPAQRVMLTDDEIEDLARGKSGHSDFARDIIEAYERKNGIK